jgi:COMPASS component BRE2
MSVEDSDRNIHFDSTFRLIGNDRGWRMSRANVFAREGSLYYEVKIIRGIPQDPVAAAEPAVSPQPHVRMGWARREAPLDGPVGFDGYSYGITDARFDTMHRSRPGKIFTPSKSKLKPKKPQPSPSDTPIEPLKENDVIGLLITLPPLPLHRKVVAGTYNPAVDFSSAPDPNAPPPDIIRDRIPIIYRNGYYFEQHEYQPTRAVIQYSDRAPSNIIVEPPHPNHEEPSLRALPNSSFVVFKNGVRMGTAFEGLLAFLPPASAPPTNVQGARQGLDNGSLGYYPAVSVFSGGMAEVNLGPKFWCPPAELNLAGQDEPHQDVEMVDAGEPSTNAGATEDSDESDQIMKPRAISERYVEQIIEDVVWDIVDEASFFVQDGGYDNTRTDLLFIPGPDGVVPMT